MYSSGTRNSLSLLFSRMLKREVVCVVRFALVFARWDVWVLGGGLYKTTCGDGALERRRSGGGNLGSLGI